MSVGLIAMGAAILLAFLRVPLAFALLSVSVIGIGVAINWNTAFLLLPLTISDAVLSYDLAVVPMFILMGNIISKTGIAHDLFRAAYAFVGHVRGGLALSTMVACAGFSAVCGSSYATAATMAEVSYPSMKKYGYSDELASGTIATGGTLGILIPPSIIMVIYGILTQTNIGHLFVAGVIPGLLGLALYMIAIRIVASRNPSHAPKGELTSWVERLRSLAGVWPFLLLFGLIIGGLYGKLFTPTEAAGMGAGLAIVIATLHGRLNLSVLRKIIIDTAYTSISLYTVLFGALMLSKLLTLSGLASGVLVLVQSSGGWCLANVCNTVSIPSARVRNGLDGHTSYIFSLVRSNSGIARLRSHLVWHNGHCCHRNSPYYIASGNECVCIKGCATRCASCKHFSRVATFHRG